jgi:putative flippase GtrA
MTFFPRNIHKLYSKFRNLTLYGIIGSCSSALDFLLYTCFVQLFSWYYIVANCLSVLAGISISFILNRNYNFRVKDKTRKRFSLFLTIGLCGMLLSNIILWVCIDQFHLDKILSKLLSRVFIVLNYSKYKEYKNGNTLYLRSSI